MKFNPKITLTQDGVNVDLTDFDVKAEVRDKARIHMYWIISITRIDTKSDLASYHCIFAKFTRSVMKLN